uniref:SBDS family rRNA metabolism protein n=1 Tax=Tetradesmus obliquus TaxID=3088 RepID=A0A383WNC8_TETOB|eukprot:jgi/Sobl393_1/13841/SZX78960.1
MSRAVKQPVGQKRLTNIAVVRLKKAGKRFEVACYRNKVSDWRAGIERDLDEVLQTTAIFANVGKGVMAAKEDLMEAFGTTDEEKICLEILAKGELQVSDKERQAQQDNLFKDVASILADKTVNPETGRPYTNTMLERALRDVHFNIDPKRSAKQQALDVLPLLQARFPIQRARMRLKLQVPQQHQQALLDALDAAGSVVEGIEQAGSAAVVVTQVEPGVFRELHVFMQDTMQRQGRIEVLSFAVTAAEAAAAADDFNALSLEKAAAAAAAADAAAAAASESAAAAAAATSSSTSSRPVHQRQHPSAAAAAGSDSAAAAGSGQRVLYPRGCIADLPEEFATRKERFAELDQLQPGWQVELSSRGETVDAVFFSPEGTKVGTFATARRQALAAHKAALNL